MEKPSIGTSDKLAIKRANFKYQKRLIQNRYYKRYLSPFQLFDQTFGHGGVNSQLANIPNFLRFLLRERTPAGSCEKVQKLRTQRGHSAAQHIFLYRRQVMFSPIPFFFSFFFLNLPHIPCHNSLFDKTLPMFSIFSEG